MSWSIVGANAEVHITPGKPCVVDIVRAETTATALKVPALTTALFELPLK